MALHQVWCGLRELPERKLPFTASICMLTRGHFDQRRASDKTLVFGLFFLDVICVKRSVSLCGHMREEVQPQPSCTWSHGSCASYHSIDCSMATST